MAALVAQGMSNGQIAASLVISVRTVETHVQHIMDKLGCSTRAQIAAWSAARPPAAEYRYPHPGSPGCPAARAAVILGSGSIRPCRQPHGENRWTG